MCTGKPSRLPLPPRLPRREDGKAVRLATAKGEGGGGEGPGTDQTRPPDVARGKAMSMGSEQGARAVGWPDGGTRSLGSVQGTRAAGLGAVRAASPYLEGMVGGVQAGPARRGGVGWVGGASSSMLSCALRPNQRRRRLVESCTLGAFHHGGRSPATPSDLQAQRPARRP